MSLESLKSQMLSVIAPTGAESSNTSTEFENATLSPELIQMIRIGAQDTLNVYSRTSGSYYGQNPTKGGPSILVEDGIGQRNPITIDSDNQRLRLLIATATFDEVFKTLLMNSISLEMSKNPYVGRSPQARLSELLLCTDPTLVLLVEHVQNLISEAKEKNKGQTYIAQINNSICNLKYVSEGLIAYFARHEVDDEIALQLLASVWPLFRDSTVNQSIAELAVAFLTTVTEEYPNSVFDARFPWSEISNLLGSFGSISFEPYLGTLLSRAPLGWLEDENNFPIIQQCLLNPGIAVEASGKRAKQLPIATQHIFYRKILEVYPAHLPFVVSHAASYVDIYTKIRLSDRGVNLLSQSEIVNDIVATDVAQATLITEITTTPNEVTNMSEFEIVVLLSKVQSLADLEWLLLDKSGGNIGKLQTLDALKPVIQKLPAEDLVEWITTVRNDPQTKHASHTSLRCLQYLQKLRPEVFVAEKSGQPVWTHFLKLITKDENDLKVVYLENIVSVFYDTDHAQFVRLCLRAGLKDYELPRRLCRDITDELILEQKVAIWKTDQLPFLSAAVSRLYKSTYQHEVDWEFIEKQLTEIESNLPTNNLINLETYGYENNLRFVLVWLLQEEDISKPQIIRVCNLLRYIPGFELIGVEEFRGILENLGYSDELLFIATQFQNDAELPDILELTLAGNLNILDAVKTVVRDRFNRSILENPNLLKVIGYFLLHLVDTKYTSLSFEIKETVKLLLTIPVWSDVLSNLNEPEKEISNRLKREMVMAANK